MSIYDLPLSDDPRYGEAGCFEGVPMWSGLEHEGQTSAAATYEQLWKIAHSPDARENSRQILIDQANKALQARAMERGLAG